MDSNRDLSVGSPDGYCRVVVGAAQGSSVEKMGEGGEGFGFDDSIAGLNFDQRTYVPSSLQKNLHGPVTLTCFVLGTLQSHHIRLQTGVSVMKIIELEYSTKEMNFRLI
jgi:hypothetical protein